MGALAAAEAAGLIAMVAEYTTGGKWSDREERMREVAAEARDLVARSLRIAEDDASAFEAVGAAYGAPKDTEEQKASRQAAIQEALYGAAQPPVAAGEVAARVVALAAYLQTQGNPNVLSDVGVAAAAARSAAQTSILNVQINRKSLKDAERRAELAQRVTGLEEVCDTGEKVYAEVLEALT